MEDTKINHIVKVNNEVVNRCEKADHLGHPLHTENTTEALAEKGLDNLNASYGYLIANKWIKYYQDGVNITE